MGSTGLDPTLGAILPLIGVILGAVLSLGWNLALKRQPPRAGFSGLYEMLLEFEPGTWAPRRHGNAASRSRLKLGP